MPVGINHQAVIERLPGKGSLGPSLEEFDSDWSVILERHATEPKGYYYAYTLRGPHPIPEVDLGLARRTSSGEIGPCTRRASPVLVVSISRGLSRRLRLGLA